MKRDNGQLIVEMMVAVSLLVIGLLGVFAVLSQSLGLNRVAANQFVAANLAAEGIEVTKNIVDANFINDAQWNLYIEDGQYEVQFDDTSLIGNEASDNPSQQKFLSLNNGRYSYDSGGEETRFKRIITIENSEDLTEIRVISRVYWRDRGGVDFDIVLEDRFKNWRQ